MEHTPIPWERDATHIFTTGEPGANVCSVSSPRKSDFVEYTRLEIGDPDFNEAMANAAFIVQAVNSHKALLKGLNDNIQTLRTLPLHPQGSTAELRIAKAINNTRVIIANATKEG